jgi:hypothetical protein
MLRALRIAVMWLLALALPLQGYAAATMLHCGASHHRVAGAHAHDDAASRHDHAGHHHDGNSTAASDASTAALHLHHHGSDGAGEFDKLSKHKCSLCASCCTSAVLPSSAVTFSTDSPVALVSPCLSRTVAAFFTDGPERPPRSLLA